MATFKINQTTTVAELKEQFRKEFGGTLRVYEGRSEAADEAPLVSLGAKEGEMECRASRTVGKFCEEFQKTLNLKVKVFTCDNWVAVLDGITLATVKEIPNMSTHAKMEKYLAYKNENTEMKTETKVKAVKIPKKYLDATIFDITFEDIDDFSPEKIDALDLGDEKFNAVMNVCDIDKYSGDFEQWVRVHKPLSLKKNAKEYIELIPQKELSDIFVSYSSKFDVYCGSKCNYMWAANLAEYGLGQYTGACHNPYDDVRLPCPWPKGFGMAIFRVEWAGGEQKVDVFEIDRVGTFELLDADIFEQVLEKRKTTEASNS